MDMDRLSLASTVSNDQNDHGATNTRQHRRTPTLEVTTLAIEKTHTTASTAPVESPSSTAGPDDQDQEQTSCTSCTGDVPPYSIFSKRKKWVIVVLTSITGVLPGLSANIYFPGVDAIEKEFHSTTALVNLTITVFMICQAISPSLWGDVADHYGRRPVYVIAILIFSLACTGLAMSPDYPTLMCLRMLQAFGSSPVTAIGAGTIADIAVPAERGGFMGAYSVGAMLGISLGPVLGGILIQLLGWRSIFWFLAIFSATLWICLFFFLPETLRSLVGNGSGYANPTPSQFLRRRWRHWRQRVHQDVESTGDKHACPEKPFHIQPRQRPMRLPNPFRSVSYLREKDVALLVLCNGFQYASNYCVMGSLTDLYKTAYGLDELQIGLCFIASGVGCVNGTFVSGRLLDWRFRCIARKLGLTPRQTRRGNMDPSFPIEQARLDLLWIWMMLSNVAMILYGWFLHMRIHLAVPLILNYIMGFCTMAISNSTNTMLVDLFPDNSAVVMASSTLTKCLLGAGAVAVISPGIDALGVGWMFTLISCVVLSTRLFVIAELKWGPTWRLRRTANHMGENEKSTTPTLQKM